MQRPSTVAVLGPFVMLPHSHAATTMKRSESPYHAMIGAKIKVDNKTASKTTAVTTLWNKEFCWAKRINCNALKKMLHLQAKCLG